MTVSVTARPPLTQQLARWGVGALLGLAGTSHLTFLRQEFRAQVPPWVPLDADDVVLLSGAVEISLGLGLLALPKERRRMAALTTAFFVGVFPGNIAQYRNRVDGLGLDTDTKRLVRLFLEPALWGASLHAGGLLPGTSDRR